MWRRATTGTMWRLGYSAFLPIGALLRLSAISSHWRSLNVE